MKKTRQRKARKGKKARKTKTQHQPKIGAKRSGQGDVGPLLVGREVRPGDLDVHFEVTSPSWALGLRVRATKLALIVLTFASLMLYAALGHDHALVGQCIDALELMFGAATHAAASVIVPIEAPRKTGAPRSSHGKARGAHRR